MINIARLNPEDHLRWKILFHGYNEFYERTLPPEMYARAWAAFAHDDRMHALGAKLDDRLVGIAHFLAHASTTGPDVCYLQDLFTAPEARNHGVATALIAEVAAWARAHDCGRVYWLTREANATARRLYERVARNRGVVVYQIDLVSAAAL